MTTLRDLLIDLVKEILDEERLAQDEGQILSDEGVEGIVDEYCEVVKEKFVG